MNICNVTVTKISSIINVHSPKGRFIEMNNRQYYGLSFCKKGKIEYTKNGVCTVSDNTCAVILPKGQSYTLLGVETGDFPLINFDTAEPLTNDFLQISLRNPDMYFLQFERMREFWQDPYGQAKAMSILYDMIDRLSHEEKQTSPILSPVLEYISNHLYEPSLSNESIASAVNISEVYLRRIFTREMNTTPKQYILDMRLRYAKQLLSEKELTVTAISEKCGFASLYHFCRAFKSATGQTPTDYSLTVEYSRG